MSKYPPQGGGDTSTISDSLIVRSSTTTSDGDLNGNTFYDTADVKVADFYNGQQVLFLSGNNSGLVRGLLDYDGTSLFTLNVAAPYQIVSGTDYMLLAATDDAVNENYLVGKRCVISGTVTVAANAGAILLFMPNKSIELESIVILSNDTITADLTSCRIYQTTGSSPTLIPANIATRSNLAAIGNYVAWNNKSGQAIVAGTTQLKMELVGTGATAVDFTIYVICYPLESGLTPVWVGS